MENNSISLTEEDSKRLQKLGEMIDVASEEFTKKIASGNWSLKQEILYLNFSAVNNYSEAVFKLCKDMRPFPAIVILRSMVEAFINTAYMLTHNSDRRIILFSMEDSYYRKSLSIEMIKFLDKHPMYEKDNFNRITFNKGIDKTNEEIDFYNKKFNFNFKSKKDFEKKYHTNLIERAKAVDRRLKKPNFEHIYILVYKYFSEFGHLSMRGLEHFILKKPNGNHEIIASQHNEIGHIVATSYTVYLYFLAKLKDQKLLNKDFPLKMYIDYWEKEFNKITPVEI